MLLEDGSNEVGYSVRGDSREACYVLKKKLGNWNLDG